MLSWLQVWKVRNFMLLQQFTEARLLRSKWMLPSCRWQIMTQLQIVIPSMQVSLSMITTTTGSSASQGCDLSNSVLFYRNPQPRAIRRLRDISGWFANRCRKTQQRFAPRKKESTLSGHSRSEHISWNLPRFLLTNNSKRELIPINISFSIGKDDMSAESEWVECR